MARNLDLTALRSFTAVADAGGVTRAAAQLNLTQSAVSMQLKRLEESSGWRSSTARRGLDRADRRRASSCSPTPGGCWRSTTRPGGGSPTRPSRARSTSGCRTTSSIRTCRGCCSSFAAAYPRVKLQLHSLYTSGLKELLGRGEMDLILTTEAGVDPGGETLSREPPGLGRRARRAGLAVAAAAVSPPARNCVFKRPALDALEAAGIPWELAVEFDLDGGDRRQRRRRPRGQRADGERRAAALRAGAPRRRAAGAAGAPHQHVPRPRDRGRRSPSGWRCCSARPTASRSAWRRSRPVRRLGSRPSLIAWRLAAQSGRTSADGATGGIASPQVEWEEACARRRSSGGAFRP